VGYGGWSNRSIHSDLEERTMICGKAQGILIRKTRARTPAKINYFRRMLREHVEGCAFCQRSYARMRTSRKVKA